MLTTALSGYTSDCDVAMDRPDYVLLYELVKHFPDVPIMADEQSQLREHRLLDIASLRAREVRKQLVKMHGTDFLSS